MQTGLRQASHVRGLAAADAGDGAGKHNGQPIRPGPAALRWSGSTRAGPWRLGRNPGRCLDLYLDLYQGPCLGP